MKAFHYAPGAIKALLCAGPVFATTMITGGAFIYSPEIDESWQLLAGIFPLAIISIPFGAILGAIPILLGGFVMGSLGVDQPASRNPIVWAIAGALCAVPMVPILSGPLSMGAVALFSFTGAVCALLVRYGTRWPGDSA